MPYILSYDSWIEDVQHYRQDGPIGQVTTTVVRDPKDPASFLLAWEVCPFCQSVMTCPIDENKVIPMAPDESFAFRLSACVACGWWTAHSQWVYDRDYIEKVAAEVLRIARKGIAKEFNVTAGELPLEALIREAKKRPQILYDVNPRKLEETVAAVFGAVMDCNVEHVGRSHDGGVDLIVLDADAPLLVQVKRRQHAEHVEPASLVREFIGAVALRGAVRGAVVSTARKFSPLAQRHARNIVSSRTFVEFDLIDFARFRDLLRLTPGSLTDPWRQHLDALRAIPLNEYLD